MLSIALSSSHSAGWWSILFIRWTFDTWVFPPGRSFADTGGGKWDLSDNLNAAAPSHLMSDQDALTIFSVSEMYLIAVICLFWVSDSFSVAHRFQFHCDISKQSWTSAMLCNFHYYASLFISKLFSVVVISKAGPSPDNILLFGQANSLA